MAQLKRLLKRTDIHTIYSKNILNIKKGKNIKYINKYYIILNCCISISNPNNSKTDWRYNNVIFEIINGN